MHMLCDYEKTKEQLLSQGCPLDEIDDAMMYVRSRQMSFKLFKKDLNLFLTRLDYNINSVLEDGYSVIVFNNIQFANNAITANSKENWIEILLFDQEGDPYIDVENKKTMTHKISGEVKIFQLSRDGYFLNLDGSKSNKSLDDYCI